MIPFLALIAFYGWMVLFNLKPVQSLDVWWHLASGRFIVESGLVPVADPFSLLCKNSRWVDSYWLFEIPLYLFYRLSGDAGLIIAKSVFVPVALFFQDRRLKEAGVSWFWRCVGVAGIFLSARPRGFGWSEEANLVSFFFVSALLWRMERFRRQGWSQSLWIWPFLIMLWANMHRGFVLGGVVIGVYALTVALTDKREMGYRALWLVLCGLATLATPYGFGLYGMIFQDLRLSPQHVAGWALTPFPHLELFWAAVVLFWGLFLGSAWFKGRPFVWTHWILACFFSLTGLRYAANAPYLMLFAWPLIVELLVDVSSRWRRPMSTSFRQLSNPAGLVIMMALLLLQALRPVQGGVNPRIYPVAACDFIAREKIKGPFYNDYRFGGYWLWRFAGTYPVFIDGRYPAVEGYRTLLPQIDAAKGGGPKEWQAFLNRAGVQAVLIDYPKSTVFPSVVEQYFPRDLWALVYWDDMGLIYLKRTPPNHTTIAQHEFKVLLPDAQEPYFLQIYRQASPQHRERIRKELLRNQQLHPASQRTHRFIDLTA